MRCWCRFTHPSAGAALIYGLGILSGAFLLSWAAEVAELDISAALAIAILALFTILPEYAIEVVMAWDAGASFDTETRAITARRSGWRPTSPGPTVYSSVSDGQW